MRVILCYGKVKYNIENKREKIIMETYKNNFSILHSYSEISVENPNYLSSQCNLGNWYGELFVHPVKKGNDDLYLAVSMRGIKNHHFIDSFVLVLHEQHKNSAFLDILQGLSNNLVEKVFSLDLAKNLDDEEVRKLLQTRFLALMNELYF